MLFLYMADRTKNTHMGNLLITTLIYKDFQLTMKGKEILKETHTVSTLKVIVKFRHTSVKDGIVDPVFR